MKLVLFFSEAVGIPPARYGFLTRKAIVPGPPLPPLARLSTSELHRLPLYTLSKAPMVLVSPSRWLGISSGTFRLLIAVLLRCINSFLLTTACTDV